MTVEPDLASCIVNVASTSSNGFQLYNGLKLVFLNIRLTFL